MGCSLDNIISFDGEGTRLLIFLHLGSDLYVSLKLIGIESLWQEKV